MELYAAMVENLDRHVGRLFDYLKAHDLYDDTLVVFMSDNGAAGLDFYNHGPFMDYIRAHYDNAYDTMGSADSFVSYGRPWAEASSAPFKRHKNWTSEGGITAPMIIAGKGVVGSSEINSAYVHVMDLAPTLLETAGARYPTDGSVAPMLGESMQPLLAGVSSKVHQPTYLTLQYHRGRAYLRQGDWKLMQLDPPFDESKFGLYNLAKDPAETTDLSAQEPEKRAELLELWRRQRVELGVVLPQDL